MSVRLGEGMKIKMLSRYNLTVKRVLTQEVICAHTEYDNGELSREISWNIYKYREFIGNIIIFLNCVHMFQYFDESHCRK